MNERIRELILQAGFEPHYEPDGTFSYSEQFEKFAELIVRECAKFAEQYIDERCGRDYCVGVGVKKHFGVEE